MRFLSLGAAPTRGNRKANDVECLQEFFRWDSLTLKGITD